MFKEQREKIDKLDEQIITLLAERFKVVDEVGRIKKEHNIAVVQQERAESVKQRVSRLGAEKGLDPDFVRHIYTVMIDHAHEVENHILERD